MCPQMQANGKGLVQLKGAEAEADTDWESKNMDKLDFGGG